jgi:hypothetical protein
VKQAMPGLFGGVRLGAPFPNAYNRTELLAHPSTRGAAASSLPLAPLLLACAAYLGSIFLRRNEKHGTPGQARPGQAAPPTRAGIENRWRKR